VVSLKGQGKEKVKLEKLYYGLIILKAEKFKPSYDILI